MPDTPHYRAIAESGWDNTPRFGHDATQVIPVDLNAQLWRYETDLARFCELLDRPEDAAGWRSRAARRRELIDRYLWVETEGFYWDLDLRTGRPLADVPRSLASFVPLWAGAADAAQASRIIEHLPLFEHDYGLAATEPGWDDGTEHNHPTGWAYSHWYVAEGLRRYGYTNDATRISLKWLNLVADTLERTGLLFERYNVVEVDGPTPGRYRPQPGFGWTNGVFAALLVRIVLGVGPLTDRGPPTRTAERGRRPAHATTGTSRLPKQVPEPLSRVLGPLLLHEREHPVEHEHHEHRDAELDQPGDERQAVGGPEQQGEEVDHLGDQAPPRRDPGPAGATRSARRRPDASPLPHC